MGAAWAAGGVSAAEPGKCAHLRTPEMLVSPRSLGAEICAPSSAEFEGTFFFFFALSDPFVRKAPSFSTCWVLSVFKGYIVRFFYRELSQN